MCVRSEGGCREAFDTAEKKGSKEFLICACVYLKQIYIYTYIPSHRYNIKLYCEQKKKKKKYQTT